MEENKKSRNETIKTIIRFAVGGLVELFVGAVTNSVVGNVDGSRFAKAGAKAGGFLVGMMIGDQVSNYICDEIDGTMEEVEKLKAAIEEGEANG